VIVMALIIDITRNSAMKTGNQLGSSFIGKSSAVISLNENNRLPLEMVSFQLGIK